MMKGKGKEWEKTRKKGGKGEKREKISIREEWQNLIVKGVKQIYFPPICTVPTYLGEKYHFGKGGGESIWFFGKIYTPVKDWEGISKMILFFATLIITLGSFSIKLFILTIHKRGKRAEKR